MVSSTPFDGLPPAIAPTDAGAWPRLMRLFLGNVETATSQDQDLLQPTNWMDLYSPLELERTTAMHACPRMDGLEWAGLAEASRTIAQARRTHKTQHVRWRDTKSVDLIEEKGKTARDTKKEMDVTPQKCQSMARPTDELHSQRIWHHIALSQASLAGLPALAVVITGTTCCVECFLYIAVIFLQVLRTFSCELVKILKLSLDIMASAN